MEGSFLISIPGTRLRDVSLTYSRLSRSPSLPRDKEERDEKGDSVDDLHASFFGLGMSTDSKGWAALYWQIL